MSVHRLWKKALIGCVVGIGLVAVVIACMLILDLALHRKFDRFASLNYRGYRGKVLGKKGDDEVRVGIFGGSIAMGYGVTLDKSIAAHLEQILNARRPSGPHVTVVNLAATGEAAPANFASSYRAFRYLDLDVVALLFTEGPSFDFQVADIADWNAFLKKVRVQDASHTKLLWSQLSPDLRSTIEADGEALSRRQLDDVVRSFNALLTGRLWFDRELLRRELGDEYAELVPAATASPAMVNRLTMERLYPELARFSSRFGQLPFSFRTGNWVFRRLGYWYIFPTVLLEKYYQLVYRSVTEGYKRDKVVPWLSHVGSFAAGGTPAPGVSTGVAELSAQEPLADSVGAITRDGKVFVFAFLPTVEQSDLSASKQYAQQMARQNARIVVADARGSFPDVDGASYFIDGQHYSDKGNRAVAKAMAANIPSFPPSDRHAR